MPIFGKSLFETVLDGLGPEMPEDEDEIASLPRTGGSLAASLVTAFAGQSDEADGSFDSLYGDFDLVPLAIDQPPEWLGRISQPEITEDLAITPDMTVRALRERRRAFARLNHPDRVAIEYRGEATIRMKIANQLLDQALSAYKH